MKIAEVVTHGLAARLLIRWLVEALEREGHEVTVVCGMPEVDRRDPSLVVVPMRRELRPIEDLVSLIRLYRFFRERRFDVVHTHTPKAGLLAPLAARIAGTPLVIHTVHGLLMHDRMPRSQRFLGWCVERFTSLFAHVLLSQSREDVDVAVAAGIARRRDIHYVGNGIDTTRFAPPDTAVRRRTRAQLGAGEGDLVLGTVSRLVYEKGYREFFAAARRLLGRFPGLRVCIVGPMEGGADQGDAVSQGELDAFLRDAGGRAHYLGMRDDMPAVYAAMDVFMLPTYREGVPRALMEASATGLPVVATDVRGCREVVEDGVTGILVAPRRTAALVAAAENLLVDEERRRMMGCAGRARILDLFDEGRVVERTLAVFGRLTRRHGLPG